MREDHVNHGPRHVASDLVPAMIGKSMESLDVDTGRVVNHNRRKIKGPLIPARYIFTALASTGLAIIYGLKVNLSVAIVAMVNHTGLAEMQSHDIHIAGHIVKSMDEFGNFTEHFEADPQVFACEAPPVDNTTAHAAPQEGPFLWTEPIQGLVLGSYFWGYIITQIPGGRIAEMFSAKWVMWASVLINAVFTLVTPVAASGSYIWMLVVRVIEGLGAGVSLPAIQVLLSKWAPPQERNRISSMVYAGMAIGTVIAMPLSGALAAGLGWESVFYFQGGLSIIWCILWVVLVFDSPTQHPTIHPEELEYLECSMGGQKRSKKKQKPPPVPWKQLLRSRPFWAILIAHTCSNFGWYMLLVELPTYMKQILRFNISQNAGLSAVPFLCLWIFSIIWSNRLDWAKRKGYLTTTSVRKISTGVGSLLPAACLVGVSLVGCDRHAAVALMTLGIMFIAGMYCGFLSNHIDIAPNYAGTLMAITNTAATIPGFIVPVFVGEMTHGHQTLGQWQIIFFTTAGVFGLEFLAYFFMGSGEEESWNRLAGNDYEPANVMGH